MRSKTRCAPKSNAFATCWCISNLPGTSRIPAVSLFFPRDDACPFIRGHMKIVLAYSGGLDTSVLLSWIKERYNTEVIAFCANIGQEEELRGLEAKAKK